MWYEDLSDFGHSPYEEKNYFRVWHPSLLRAVGWLELGKPYSTGLIDGKILDSLTELRVQAWQPILLWGYHQCDLCSREKGPLGVTNLFIPGDGFLYVSPVDHSLHRNTPIRPTRRVLCGSARLSSDGKCGVPQSGRAPMVAGEKQIALVQEDRAANKDHRHARRNGSRHLFLNVSWQVRSPVMQQDAVMILGELFHGYDVGVR